MLIFGRSASFTVNFHSPRSSFDGGVDGNCDSYDVSDDVNGISVGVGDGVGNDGVEDDAKVKSFCEKMTNTLEDLGTHTLKN